MRLRAWSSGGLVEVILGDGHILAAHDAAGALDLRPMRGWEASARAWITSAAGLAVDRPVHFILHGGEELLGQGRGIGRVVHAGGINIENLLVEAGEPLGGANVPDALQLLVEVILLAFAGRILEPLVVHGEALDEVFPEALGGPDAKLGAPVAFDPVTDGDDDVEVVELDLVGFSVGGSCCRILQQLNSAPVRPSSNRFLIWREMTETCPAGTGPPFD